MGQWARHKPLNTSRSVDLNKFHTLVKYIVPLGHILRQDGKVRTCTGEDWWWVWVTGGTDGSDKINEYSSTPLY